MSRITWRIVRNTRKHNAIGAFSDRTEMFIRADSLHDAMQIFTIRANAVGLQCDFGCVDFEKIAPDQETAP